jgi:hypothetical protein
MKCPHCTVEFHDNETVLRLQDDPDGCWGVGMQRCAACNRLVVTLFAADYYYDMNGSFSEPHTSYLVRPKSANRPPVPPQVPVKYSDDYREACLVLNDSAKASAALSRRCLQHILREEAKVVAPNLYGEIQAVIDKGLLPSHISESLDAVRNIGNFAAHPIKSQSTGEIVAVEPGEADWNLDVLESLFDFYFVLPARTKERKEALNKKLSDAGKPKIK